MGSVKRQTYTRAVPTGAVIDGLQVRWTVGGKRHSGELITKEGKQVVRTKTETYYAKFRDADGLVQTVSTGCRDREAAR